MIKGAIINVLNVIKTPGGNVMHAMKESSSGYLGFGEAYFSKIDKGAIKAWKRHTKMTLNLVVPVGEIKFVMFDDRDMSNTQFQEIIISEDNYCRLTVPPMVWLGFQGLSDGGAILLNIANIEHNSKESESLTIEKINYEWSTYQ
jgi:dTDP-4-dehydrorhamnose 3,5-epimerase